MPQNVSVSNKVRREGAERQLSRLNAEAAHEDSLRGVGLIECIVGQHHAAANDSENRRQEIGRDIAARSRLHRCAGYTGIGIAAVFGEVGRIA